MTENDMTDERDPDADTEAGDGPVGYGFPFGLLERYAPWLLGPALEWSLRLSERDAERIHAVLDRSRRVDLEPTSGPGRGFRLIVDRRLALYFRQEGDGFDYDGYEVGEYDKGDVTILDGIGPEDGSDG